MSNIINHLDFSTYRSTVNPGGKQSTIDKIEQSITQAHSDLREALGDAFYFDVIKNQTNPEYADLMNGSEFNVGDYPFQHEGLKSLVADYAYARYLYESNVQHTPGGMVMKNSQDSTQVDRNFIKDLVKQTNIDASKKWELIEAYLENNKDTFKVWAKQQESGNVNTSSSFNQTRFTFLSTGRK